MLLRLQNMHSECEVLEGAVRDRSRGDPRPDLATSRSNPTLPQAHQQQQGHPHNRRDLKRNLSESHLQQLNRFGPTPARDRAPGWRSHGDQIKEPQTLEARLKQLENDCSTLVQAAMQATPREGGVPPVRVDDLLSHLGQVAAAASAAAAAADQGSKAASDASALAAAATSARRGGLSARQQPSNGLTAREHLPHVCPQEQEGTLPPQPPVGTTARATLAFQKERSDDWRPDTESRHDLHTGKQQSSTFPVTSKLQSMLPQLPQAQAIRGDAVATQVAIAAAAASPDSTCRPVAEPQPFEPQPASPLPTARGKHDGSVLSSASSAHGQEGGDAAPEFRPTGSDAHAIVVATATPATMQGAALVTTNPPPKKQQLRAEAVKPRLLADPAHRTATPPAQLHTLQILGTATPPAQLRTLQTLGLQDLEPVELEECRAPTARTDSRTFSNERVARSAEAEPPALKWWQQWVPGPIRELWCSCTADGSEVVEDLPQSIPAGPPLPLVDGRGRRPHDREQAAVASKSYSSKTAGNGFKQGHDYVQVEDGKALPLHHGALPLHHVVGGRQNCNRDLDGTVLATQPGVQQKNAGAGTVNRKAFPQHHDVSAGQNEVRDLDGTILSTRSGSQPRLAASGTVNSYTLASSSAAHAGQKVGQSGSHDVDGTPLQTHRGSRPGHAQACKQSSVQEPPLASSRSNRSKSSVASSQAVPAAPPPTPRFSIPQRGSAKRRDRSGASPRR